MAPRTPRRIPLTEPHHHLPPPVHLVAAAVCPTTRAARPRPPWPPTTPLRHVAIRKRHRRRKHALRHLLRPPRRRRRRHVTTRDRPGRPNAAPPPPAPSTARPHSPRRMPCPRRCHVITRNHPDVANTAAAPRARAHAPCGPSRRHVTTRTDPRRHENRAPPPLPLHFALATHLRRRRGYVTTRTPRCAAKTAAPPPSRCRAPSATYAHGHSGPRRLDNSRAISPGPIHPQPHRQTPYGAMSRPETTCGVPKAGELPPPSQRTPSPPPAYSRRPTAPYEMTRDTAQAPGVPPPAFVCPQKRPLRHNCAVLRPVSLVEGI